MIQEHYYYFGENLQQKMVGKTLDEHNWNILRLDDVEGQFTIEKQ